MVYVSTMEEWLTMEKRNVSELQRQYKNIIRTMYGEEKHPN